MTKKELESKLAESSKMVNLLKEELAQTNRGLIALTVELEDANDRLLNRNVELQASEERFRTLVLTIPDIVYRIDPDGRFTFINDAINRLGYTVDELIGEHFDKFVMAADVASSSRRKVLPRLQGQHIGGAGSPGLFDERRSGSRRTNGLEVRLVSKDRKKVKDATIHPLDHVGVQVEVSSAGVYEPNPDSKEKVFIGTVGVIRDITVRKELEKNLLNAYSEMENKVRERTRDLRHINKELRKEIEERSRLEIQLRQSQKMEALGTMAGGIAHDFNNILGVIMGFTELSIEDLDESNIIKSNLKQVLASAHRAKDMVQQILAFSRQSKPEMKPVMAGTIIKEGLKLLRSTLPASIDICSDIKDTGSRVMADATQLHQILMNLCSNAAFAMRKKGGILNVNIKTADLDERAVAGYDGLAPGRYLILSVTDSGVGMKKNLMDRVFDPYFTTKKPGEGTGMGLAVVHGIVKSYNGDITVSSLPGKGTTFNVLLPLCNDKQKETPEVRQSLDLPRGRERILLVDDELRLLEMQKRALSMLGYSVDAYSDSKGALEAFNRSPQNYDILITDQTMPKMVGLELSRSVMKVRPGFPIILCTGFSEQVNQDTVKGNGIRKLMMKPFTIQNLAQSIREVLE